MSAEKAAGVTVALDVMGAERGSEAVAEGVRAAVADGISVRAFGLAEALEPLLAIDGVETVQAADWIGNDVEPAATVRAKPAASTVPAAAAAPPGPAGARGGRGRRGPLAGDRQRRLDGRDDGGSDLRTEAPARGSAPGAR